jgi:hypothetical protein
MAKVNKSKTAEDTRGILQNQLTKTEKKSNILRKTKNTFYAIAVIGGITFIAGFASIKSLNPVKDPTKIANVLRQDLQRLEVVNAHDTSLKFEPVLGSNELAKTNLQELAIKVGGVEKQRAALIDNETNLMAQYKREITVLESKPKSQASHISPYVAISGLFTLIIFTYTGIGVSYKVEQNQVHLNALKEQLAAL